MKIDEKQRCNRPFISEELLGKNNKISFKLQK